MDTDFHDDDDAFSDADFDDLPPNTFVELERRAIASTQGVPQSRKPEKTNDQDKRAKDFNGPVQGAPAHRLGNAGVHQRGQSPGSDYGFLDDTVINLDEPTFQHKPKAPYPDEFMQHGADNTEQLNRNQHDSNEPFIDVAALQARILEVRTSTPRIDNI